MCVGVGVGVLEAGSFSPFPLSRYMVQWETRNPDSRGRPVHLCERESMISAQKTSTEIEPKFT